MEKHNDLSVSFDECDIEIYIKLSIHAECMSYGNLNLKISNRIKRTSNIHINS